MKKIIAIILSLTMVICMAAGCGSNSSAPETQAGTDAPSESKEQQTAIEIQTAEPETQKSNKNTMAGDGEFYIDELKVAISSLSNTWSPFQTQSPGSGEVVTGIYPTLMVSDSKGNGYLYMLKSVKEVDELTYECELWDFITDTAGNNIVASDVEWSIQQVIDGGNSRFVDKLDHIEVTGDYTFIWHNKSPFLAGDMIGQFSKPLIASRKSFEESGDDMAGAPIGAGAYKLTEYAEGSYCVLEARDDYWFYKIDDEEWLKENDTGAFYQNVKKIRLDVITDSTAKAIALENGEVDACGKMNATDVLNYMNDPNSGITSISIPAGNPVAFMFNCSEYSVCQDIELRKAICYAIDNAGIAEGLDIPAIPAYSMKGRQVDSPESWYTGEGRDYYDFSIDKAKECLEKSNYNGEPVTVAFVGTNKTTESVLIMAQSTLAEAGINLKLLGLENSVLMDNKLHPDSGWDMLCDNFGGGNYLQGVLKNWYTPTNAKDLGDKLYMGISDPELDARYEAVRDEDTEEAFNAWDEYWTYEKCYGYATVLYDELTACSSNYIPALAGFQNTLCIPAFVPAE